MLSLRKAYDERNTLFEKSHNAEKCKRAFWKSSLLQNIKKLKNDSLESIKNFPIKSHKAEPKSKDAQKRLWLKYGFQPATTGFPLNRLNSVPKSGTYRVSSVV